MRGFFSGFFCLLLTILGVFLCSSAARAANFNVNSPLDVPDAFVADGICDTSGIPGPNGVPYSGQCSLRAAIDEANFVPGRDSITIGAPVPVASKLPNIIGPVAIQPAGTSRASISWAGGGNSPDGLVFTFGANLIQRLEISGFKSGAAIRLTGTNGSIVTGNLLSGNDLGLAIVGPPNNEIGTPGRGNVISGNRIGIYINGPSATGNRIIANVIGLDEAGSLLPNTNAGIFIEGANGTWIGSPTVGNVISGNGGDGIIVSDAQDTKIQSNYIGTDAVASTVFGYGNRGEGIFLHNAGTTQIGGPSTSTISIAPPNHPGSIVQPARVPTDGKFPGNVISANHGNGILIDGVNSRDNVITGNLIGLAANGRALGNYMSGVRIVGASANKVGLPGGGAGNFISANGRVGVRIEQPTAIDNLVQGNWIGTGFTGIEHRGNGTIGVLIDGAKRTIVGGARLGEANLISSNGFGGVFGPGYTGHSSGQYAGVHIFGSTATDNRVQGNIIGMDHYGVEALANSGSGVIVEDGTDNVVGGYVGATYYPRNLISGNEGSGVVLRGAAERNRVSGNYIGTDAMGSLPASPLPTLMRSQAVGVWIDRAPRNIIGGDDETGRNIIAHNKAQGVLITGVSAASNIIRSNHIGVDRLGMTEIANGESGIAIRDAPLTRIGDATKNPGKAPGNVISGNEATLKVGAVHIEGATAKGTIIRGNAIGVGADGKTPLPNGYDGVLITDGASETLVGGGRREHGNIIAYNERLGVGISNGQAAVPATRNSVLSNSIFANKVLGIDLGLDRATPNPKRVKAGLVTAIGSGANDNRASPNLFLMPSKGWATLEGPPNTAFRVQLFGSERGHVTGYGEGERYIDTVKTTTNANGFASFAVKAAKPGEVLSATATDAQGNTSEFSRLPCPIAPADVNKIDSRLIDNNLVVSARWIPLSPLPPAKSLTLGKDAIPMAAGVDTHINLEITASLRNPRGDDDIRKAFVVITIDNLADTEGAPAMRIYRERQPLDASGKMTVTLSADEMLRELGAAENRNFLEAHAQICYRGRVQSATAPEVLHVLREKLVLFLPGVLGSKIEILFPPVVGPSMQVFPTVLPASIFLAMGSTGNPVYKAEKLSMFDNILGVPAVYKIAQALEEARKRNKLPDVEINGRKIEYFHLQPWAYDWRLSLDQHVNALVNGTGGPTRPMVEPRSVHSLVSDFVAGNRYADDKAALIGHSTGGLIVRAALMGANGAALQTDVDRAYFLNAPFLGAPKAYYAFLTGDMGLEVRALILQTLLQSLAPNMPVIYHLAPGADYYDGALPIDPAKQLTAEVVASYTDNGVDKVGIRTTAADSAHKFMDDLTRLAGTGTTWNQLLERQAEDFHQRMRQGRPTIGWRNTLVFASANPKLKTPGRVTFTPGGGVDRTYTLGDETVPLASQIGDVPAYITMVTESKKAPEHVAAASSYDVWDELLDHLAAREEKDFSGETPKDSLPITPPANACRGSNRTQAIRSAENFGERQMTSRVAALNYAAIQAAAAGRRYRQGFDAVYCDGEVVPQLRDLGGECQGTQIIGEGKGGYAGRDLENVLGSGYGFRQATLEWAAAAAQATSTKLRGKLFGRNQRRTARAYLTSLEAGADTRIEVFHSECVSNYPPVKPPPPTPPPFLYKRYVSDETP